MKFGWVGQLHSKTLPEFRLLLRSPGDVNRSGRLDLGIAAGFWIFLDCVGIFEIIKPLQISTSLTCHYLSIVAEVEALM